MNTNAAAYYLYPPTWIDSAPPGVGHIARTRWGDEVYRGVLPFGIRVKVLRDGLFVFDFTAWALARAAESQDFDEIAAIVRKRAMVLNAHLACLYTTLLSIQNLDFPKMALSPSDIGALGEIDSTGIGFGDIRVAAMYQRFSRHTAPDVFVEPTLEHRSFIVDAATITESFRLLTGVLGQGLDALVLADLFARSCGSYEDHDYELSVVTSWTIIEKALHVLWEGYLDQNRERGEAGRKVIFINSERRKVLANGRDYSAAVVSEILSLVDALPFPLYQRVNKVRRQRNAWLHSLGAITRQTASLSIEVAQEMLRLVHGFSLRVGLGSRIHG